MGYLYSQRNRLEEPHSYMYTPYGGMAFLESYLASRLECLHDASSRSGSTQMPNSLLLSRSVEALAKNFDATSPKRGAAFRALAGIDDKANDGDAGVFDLNALSDRLPGMKLTQSVVTSDLLCALVASQFTGAHPAETKFWLDRLVQRFEVTKKLFEAYPPGFRKGEGSSDSVRLYWLLALALCLFHSASNQLKYLSTLLKVCDLLCSVRGTRQEAGLPYPGLAVVLAAEISSVRRLAEMKELSLGSE